MKFVIEFRRLNTFVLIIKNKNMADNILQLDEN